MFSIVASVAHGLEEGSGDLIGYFCRIAKLPKPTAEISIALLGVVLPSALAMMAALGYQEGSCFALNLLFAARVTDSLLSHWTLAFVERPNPGIWSTTLYAVEAVVLFYIIDGEFRPDGLVAGSLPFLVTNPLWLRLFA